MNKNSKLTLQEIEDFIIKKFGSAVGSVAELSSGMFSKAYSYKINDNNEFVLRLNGEVKDFKKDIYALKFKQAKY